MLEKHAGENREGNITKSDPISIQGKERTGMKMIPVVSRTVALVVASVLVFAGAAFGAELNVMSSGGFTAAYRDLLPEFERATQNKS